MFIESICSSPLNFCNNILRTPWYQKLFQKLTHTTLFYKEIFTFTFYLEKIEKHHWVWYEGVIINMGLIEMPNIYDYWSQINTPCHYIIRKKFKWWRKLFFWDFETYIVNSYILYKECVRMNNEKCMEYKKFR